MTDKNAMWVKCGDCNHVWVAVYLPMELSKAARLMKSAACGRCAAPAKRVFLAAAADIPKEPATA